MPKSTARILGPLFLCLSTVLWAQAPLAPEAYQQLKYRYIGPVGNRTTAVIGIAGNPTGDDQDHGECWYPSSPDLCVFTRVQIVVLSVEKKEVKALLS